MVMMGTSPSSLAMLDAKASSVSMRIWRTEGSRPDRSSSLVASMNFLSMWRVKPGPGLSAKIRMSMMALYWHEAFESRAMNLRIRRAHVAAAIGEATAASTMEGRKMTSSPCDKSACRSRGDKALCFLNVPRHSLQNGRIVSELAVSIESVGEVVQVRRGGHTTQRSAMSSGDPLTTST